MDTSLSDLLNDLKERGEELRPVAEAAINAVCARATSAPPLDVGACPCRIPERTPAEAAPVDVGQRLPLSDLAMDLDIGATEATWWKGGVSERPWWKKKMPDPANYQAKNKRMDRYAEALHLWARDDQAYAHAFTKNVAATDVKQNQDIASWMKKAGVAAESVEKVQAELNAAIATTSQLKAELHNVKAKCGLFDPAQGDVNSNAPAWISGAADDAEVDVGWTSIFEGLVQRPIVGWNTQPWTNVADKLPNVNDYGDGKGIGWNNALYAEHLYKWYLREDSRMQKWLANAREKDVEQAAGLQFWKDMVAKHTADAAALGGQVIGQLATNKKLKAEIQQLKLKCGQVAIKGHGDDLGLGAAPSVSQLADQIAALGADLKKGDKGPLVGVWQSFLLLRGFAVALGQPVLVDNAFGPITEAATKAYQGSVGVPQTGVVDAATRASVVPAPPPAPPTPDIEATPPPVEAPPPPRPRIRFDPSALSKLAKSFTGPAPASTPAMPSVSRPVAIAAGVAIAGVAAGIAYAALRGNGKKP